MPNTEVQKNRLEQKRNAEKLRRQKIRDDPEAYEKYCQKERARNEKRKIEGKLKLVQQLSDREKRARRKLQNLWKKNSRARQKKIIELEKTEDLNCNNLESKQVRLGKKRIQKNTGLLQYQQRNRQQDGNGVASAHKSLLSASHIQFENVVIKIEQEDQFYKENVEESFVKPLVNQDETKSFLSQNDINLTSSAIKKENKDFEEHLHERYDNILETFDSEYEKMETNVEQNAYLSLYSEKFRDHPLINLDKIKIDIVDNHVESVNDETYIKYKIEGIEESLEEDRVKTCS